MTKGKRGEIIKWIYEVFLRNNEAHSTKNGIQHKKWNVKKSKSMK